MPLLAGPVASACIDRWGCRPTVIVGGAISALGFLLSYFTPSLPLLFLTFGLISGFGFSLTFSASIVAVTYYFDKRRAIATGLTGMELLYLTIIEYMQYADRVLARAYSHR